MEGLNDVWQGPASAQMVADADRMYHPMGDSTVRLKCNSMLLYRHVHFVSLLS
jgi:hypothetical protein